MTGRRVNTYLNILVLVLLFSIPLYRKWAGLAAPLVTLLWFFEGRFRAKLAVLRHHALTLAVLAFIALYLLSIAWSSDPGAAFDYVSKFRYLLLVPVIATSLRGPFRRLALPALAAGTILAVLLESAVFWGVIRFRQAYPGNPSPTMSHLDFSVVLAVAALLALNHAIVAAGSWRRRTIWLAASAVITGGLVINIGRSGQVAFAGTLLILVPIYLARRPGRTVTAGLLAVLLGLALTYAAIPGLHRRLETGASDLRRALVEHQYHGNLGKRVAGIIVALDLIREHPILGAGPVDNMTGFRHLLDTRYEDLKSAVYWFPHLHNQYLQTASEVGLVGAAVLLGMFACLVWGPYTDREDRVAAVILAAVFLLGFVGDPYLHKQLPLTLFATVAGVISARGRSIFWEVEGADRSG